MRQRTRLLAGAAAVAVVGAGAAAYRLRKTSDERQLGRFRDLSGAPFGPPEPARDRRTVSGNARLLAPTWEPAPLTALAEWLPKPPRSPLGRAAAYCWAAPLSIAGFLVAALSGGRPEIRDGVVVFRDAKGLSGAFLRLRGFRGTALGHVVICRGEPDESLMAHELLHVRQAERLGPLFGPVYLGLLAVYGYARHPMERAARTAARRQLGAPA